MPDELESYLEPLPKPARPKSAGRLDPQFETQINEILTSLQKRGLRARLAEGYRSPEKQEEYYAQGRTRPGPIITYARGTTGKHPRGVAADIDLIDESGRPLPSNRPEWKVLGEEAGRRGLTWGGSWRKLKDLRHIESTRGGRMASSQLPRDDLEQYLEPLESYLEPEATPSPSPRPRSTFADFKKQVKPGGGAGPIPSRLPPALRRARATATGALAPPETIETPGGYERTMPGQPGVRAPRTTIERVLDFVGEPSSALDPRIGLKYLQRTQREPTPEETLAEAARQERVSKMSTGEQLAQFPKSVALGAAGMAETSLKSLAALSKKTKGVIAGGLLTEAVANKVFNIPEAKEATQHPYYQLGESLGRNARQILRSNPDLEQDFFVGKTPSTLGQVAVFVLGGWASKAPKLAVTILGGLSTAGDTYDEARQAGATDEEAVNAALIAGAILGPTELIGMRGLMKSLAGTGWDATLRAAMKTALREGRRDAVENTLQEIGQELAQGKITGRGRSLEELAEAGILGGIGGTATIPTTLAQRAPIGRRGRETPTPAPTEAQAREQVAPQPSLRERLVGPEPVTQPEGARVSPEARAGIDRARADVRRALEERRGAQVQTQPDVPAQPETAEPEVVASPIDVVPPDTRERAGIQVSGIRPEAGTAAVEPQRFYHKQFGELEVLEDQTGAGKNRYRVAEVANPEIQHFVKKSDLRGRGNERMVPLKAEPEAAQEIEKNITGSITDPAPDLEQYLEPPSQVSEAPSERQQENEPSALQAKYDAARAKLDALGPEVEASNALFRERQQPREEVISREPRTVPPAVGEAVQAEVGRAETQLPARPASLKRLPGESQRAFRARQMMAKAEAPEGVKARKAPKHAIGRPKSDPVRNSVATEAAALGGIKPTENFRGEVRRLGSIPGFRHLVNSTSGLDAEKMIHALAERGYILPGVERSEGQGGFTITDVNAALSAIEDDVRGITKHYSSQHEHDYEAEYVEWVEQQESDYRAEALLSLIEGGRGGELFDRIVERKASDAERSEFNQLAEDAGADPAELDRLIRERIAEAEAEAATLRETPGRVAPARRAEQLGFVEEGLTQQSAPPPKAPDQRARLVEEEKQRQRARDPERAAAQDQLASIRERGMTVDEFARQGSLLGETVSPERLKLLREIEASETSAPPSEPKLPEVAEPDFVRTARERKAKREAEKAKGIEYRRAGADPYELIDDIIVRGYELYSQKIKPTYEEWSRRIREEFGAPSERHLKNVWNRLNAEPPEPSTTSARKAQFAEDREALDLPELPPAERKSWQTSLDRAKPERATLLADEVLNRPRALNDEETASIVVRAQQLKNEHSAKMREIEKAPESKIPNLRVEVEALEREFDKLTTAARLSGTEKGRALAAQKLTINQDYDLVSLIQRAKAAKGRELTTEERTRYEKMAKEIQSLQAQLAQAEEAARTQELQKQINRAARKRKRAETKKELDEEFASLTAQFAQARQAMRSGIQPSGLAAIDPEGVLTKLIGQMARNRVRAGVIKAEDLVDEIYNVVASNVRGVSKRDVRDAISGYGLEPKHVERDEAVKQLASIRSELKKLSTQEDIEAGKRLSAREKRRQTVLQKQEEDIRRRLEQKDFEKPLARPIVEYTPAVRTLQTKIDNLKRQYDKELHRAQRGVFGRAWDIGVNVANIPKTLKSMGDFSALLRQGGYFSVTHPIISKRAAVNMFRSLTEAGFKNVEHSIKIHPDYQLAKRAGVEFTGVDKESIPLSEREEAFLSTYVSKLPIAKQSEQTFVSFLDSQRMMIFERFAEQLRSQGLTPESNPNEYRAVAKLINIGTGRGSLGHRGNQIAPALNALMFSPRLLASRVQLLNKMVNPVAIKRMPPAARKMMIRDNVKFAGTIAATLALAAAAGAKVSLDPDEADFLKIRIGDTRYDILTGIQQPLRFIWRMVRAFKADITQHETYAGPGKAEMLGRFARTKASPTAGFITDYITGEDFEGRKFKLSRGLIDLATPLYLDDFREALKEDSVIVAAAKTSPAVVGIGALTYKDSPEKPKTHAEKLARKLFTQRMPDEAREEEQINIDQKKAELRARTRRGENVSQELQALGPKITVRQAKAITSARGKSRLQEDFNRLGVKDALVVWSVMSPEQQNETREIMMRKASLVDALPVDEQPAVRQKLSEFGINRGRGVRPIRPSRP